MSSTPSILRAASSHVCRTTWQARVVLRRETCIRQLTSSTRLSSLRSSGRPRIQHGLPSQSFQKQAYRFESDSAPIKHLAYIGLGSNMGDRIAMIEQACKEMEVSGSIKVTTTSSLWESPAMYVVDQDPFINAVCEIETTLKPIELLDELQAVENRMGRVKIIDKGPRNIDLDILLYENVQYNDERLQIPHLLMHEREFVQRPLLQILRPSFQGQTSVATAPSKRRASDPAPKPSELSLITPIGPLSPPITTVGKNRKTHIMSILNVTPDSFSDGGTNFNADEVTLLNTIKSHIADGATIIDVGGQSTRPGAVQISAEEEWNRIAPAIRLIRSLPEATNIAISVDTYHASVAESAVQAGASMINDVSGGTMDAEMLPTVARLGCTICLMHMRGTPETMSKLTKYPRGVLQGVADELKNRVKAAYKAGIRHWRIILDPGIGFAKTTDQNLFLLKALKQLRRKRPLSISPCLVGTSRKGFIGEVLGVEEAKERVMGTAATVAAAIRGGAAIVRVHDVKEMAQVAKMTDAIYKAKS